MISLRKNCLLSVLITSLAMIVLPLTASAYTTPGTGVNWTGDDLVANSGGIVTMDETEGRLNSTEGIVIALSDTLNLGGNIHIDAEADNDLLVQGLLNVGTADTTATDTIIISGAGTDGPTGIKVEENGFLNMYRVLMVGGGGDGDDAAVQVSAGTAYIYGCRFTNWNGYVLNTYGALDLTAVNCIIHDNFEYGVGINNGSTGTIRGCYFENNNLTRPSSPKNVINVGIQGANTALIDGCHIIGAEGNSAGGIVVSNLLGVSQTAVVRNTIVENCSYGISVQYENASAEIYDCQFINNTAVNNPDYYGMGISALGPSSVKAAGNIITGNLWGITASPNRDGVSPVLLTLGIDGSTDPAEQGHNQIHDNHNDNYDHGWDLWNNSALNIFAQNNYWGTTDLATIATNIHDQADDASKGLVTYEPIWDGTTNNPPVIDSYSPSDSLNITVEVGESITFDGTASDPDGDELTHTFYLDGEALYLALPGSITFETVGVDTVELRFTDTHDASVSVTWIINVVESTNVAPTITSHTPAELTLTVNQGDDVEFTVTATDEDGDELHYAVLKNNTSVGTTIPATITFSEVGTDTISIFAYDPSDAFDFVQWIVTVQEASSANEAGLLPTEFDVTAYPNPFNAQLSLQYSLPTNTNVTFSVYSIDGRLVHHAQLGAKVAGTHEVSWNANRVSSGVYFVKFAAGSQTINRKVTLIR